MLLIKVGTNGFDQTWDPWFSSTMPRGCYDLYVMRKVKLFKCVIIVSKISSAFCPYIDLSIYDQGEIALGYQFLFTTSMSQCEERFNIYFLLKGYQRRMTGECEIMSLVLILLLTSKCLRHDTINL